MHRDFDCLMSRKGVAQPLVALAAGLFVALSLAPASAKPIAVGCGCQPREQDQVWLVSDRGAGCGVSADGVRLQYWQHDSGKGWVRSDLDSLLAAEVPQVATTVFVHGNRIPACEAFTKGWLAYRTLAGCADERPIRFIIWSWASDTLRGPVNDARVKASRTNSSGYRLAWLLDRLDGQTPVSLWGHSFGARIVTGAMHLLGGGELCGYRLSERVHRERAPMQAVLLVAAIDNHWLLPGHFHGQAISQAREMLWINNSCDALLKRYHVIYGRRCTVQAAGYAGVVTRGLSDEDRAKIRQLDACCQVGRRHLFAGYLASPSLLSAMRHILLDDADLVDGPESVVAENNPPAMQVDTAEQQSAEVGS